MQGQKERAAKGEGKTLDMTKDVACLQYLLSTPFAEQMLEIKDEAYDNTLLHIAVSVNSATFVEQICKVQKVRDAKNKEDKTAMDELSVEIEMWKERPESDERDNSL